MQSKLFDNQSLLKRFFSHFSGGSFRGVLPSFFLVLTASLNVCADEFKFSWEMGAQARLFAEEASYGQENQSASLRAQAEFYYAWNDGQDSVEFIPWYVVDQHDEKRTHGDIQELAWIHVGEGWELRTGIRKVFWGVTESAHLVDIINQSDFSRGFDGEDKLGQPMVNLSLVRDWGIVDFFILPGHRKRIYSGEDGRPRSTLVITDEDATYESDDDDRRVDAAIRWQKTLGDWELALSHFTGTSRDPSLIGVNAENELLTYYPEIDQTGLEALYIAGDWIWKFESIVRSGQGRQFTAATGGTEYTQVGVFETDIDLGWIAEYSADDRGADAPHASERDIVVGTRWTVNDAASSQALVFVSVDIQTGEQLWSLEASRRFYEDWFVTVDMFLFGNVDDAPTVAEALSGPADTDAKLASFKKDNYLQIEVVRYF